MHFTLQFTLLNCEHVLSEQKLSKTPTLINIQVDSKVAQMIRIMKNELIA